MSISREHLRRIFLIISGSIYVCSMPLPALLFERHEPLTGIDILPWGWWGVLMLEFAWFANPAYIAAVLAFASKNNRFSMRACLVSLVLGLASFHAKEWWFNEGSGTKIIGLGAGYYVWMLSFCILLVGCLITPAPNPAVERTLRDKAASRPSP